MSGSSLKSIAQRVLELEPRRFMFSPQELAQLESIEREGIPVEKIFSWLDEYRKESREPTNVAKGISFLIERLERMNSQQVGHSYEGEASEIQDRQRHAFIHLINEVKQSAHRPIEHQEKALFEWLLQQLHRCAKRCEEDQSIDPCAVLAQLEESLRLRALQSLSSTQRSRLKGEVEKLIKRDLRVGRPQDILRAQVQVEWRLLRDQLRLPQLLLSPYGRW